MTSHFKRSRLSEVYHLAWLNWEKDGFPADRDMEYFLAAESLVQSSAERKGGPQSGTRSRRSQRS